MQEPDFPANEKQRIATLHSMGVLDSAEEERFDRLTEIAKHLFNVPYVMISLVDNDREWFKSTQGLNYTELPRSRSFCGHAILEKEAFVVNDATLDPRFSDNPYVANEPNVRFYAGQPICAANGDAIGALCILDDKARKLNRQERHLLKNIALLVEREFNYPDLKTLNDKLLRSEQELLDSIDKLRLSQGFSEAKQNSLEMISRGFPLDEVLDSITHGVELQNPSLIATIMVLNPHQPHLGVAATSSLPDYLVDALDGISIDDDSWPCSNAVKTGKRLVVEDMCSEPMSDKVIELCKRANINSSWCEPVKSADGRVLGLLAIYKQERGAPRAEELEMVKRSASLTSIALERDQADRQAWRQANYDSLTRLPNRNLFRERLNQEILKAKRNQHTVAILFIDLDRFKEVNDSLGHIKGDDLLVQTATRLSSCVRQIDTVARIGGDEFIIVMGELESKEHASPVAKKIITALSEKFILDQETAYISGSIGISFYPDHGEDMTSLVRCADRAMYISKNRGRNRFTIYSE